MKLAAAAAWGFDAWGARAPGMLVAAVLALVAGWIAGGLGEPLARNPVLVAMLFGLVIGNTFGCPEALKPGLDFTRRCLLRLAVALIGFRITVRLLADLGVAPIAIAAAELVLVLLVVRWVAVRLFKLDRELALLVAAGSAVCGASAILAVAALTRARTQQAGMSITLITVFGTIALLVYPIAFLDGWLPKLDDEQYGVFVGASIYELAQVYGASYAVSELALNTATLVKLTKVLMLVPLLFVLGYIRRRREAVPVPFPWFIAAFVGATLANSAVTLHPLVRSAIFQLDLFLFLMVMIALGLDTRLSRLREEGGALALVGAGILALVLSTAAAYGLVRSASPAQAAGGPQPAESAALRNEGGRLFISVGCAKCHVPALPAGDREVTLYSDLLLHEMGPALDDKIVQGEATGRDWRTAPLAGLRLRGRYLHDGRATMLRDAILAHGGEAEIVRDRFFDLSEANREAIYRFLGSL
ncbi:MAG TPA: putative sulfate exporter family transporter [Burkholderiales bacterium]|nr:putative sulfate exporter family transporter [Burkholderiales bacterium]